MISLRNIDLRFGDMPILRLDAFELKRGECVAVTGPSGAGKSSLGRYLAGRMGKGFHNRALVAEASPPSEVLLVPQNVSEQLHGGLPLGRQFQFVADSLGKRDWRRQVTDAFAALNLPDPERLLAAYPGALSTGMCQRVLLALADFRAPALVIADEVSSALDAENAERCIGWFLSRVRQRGGAAVVITHDPGIARRYCDRTVSVSRPGPIAASAPRPATQHERPRPAAAAPVLCADNLAHRIGGRTIFQSLSLSLSQGEIVGISGPSGVGKTSLLRILAGLSVPSSGRITRAPGLRRRGAVMMVFQSPELILNPYLTVEALLAETLRYACPSLDRDRWPDLCLESLGQCGLDPDVLAKRPAQLSGGQRQRVAIAKVLLARPDLVLCDEPSSQLDQASAQLVFQLLEDRAARHGLACIVVSHDRGSLGAYCNRTLEMRPTGLRPLPDHPGAPRRSAVAAHQ